MLLLSLAVATPLLKATHQTICATSSEPLHIVYSNNKTIGVGTLQAIYILINIVWNLEATRKTVNTYTSVVCNLVGYYTNTATYFIMALTLQKLYHQNPKPFLESTEEKPLT